MDAEWLPSTGEIGFEESAIFLKNISTLGLRPGSFTISTHGMKTRRG